MFLGYNTNGFAHHRLEDVIEILAEIGYQGIALTVDVHHLDPYASDLKHRLAVLGQQLTRHRFRCVIETGARFLLNPRRKHQPTLLSSSVEGRAHRLDFLKRCVDVATELQAECVSFWSGSPDEPAPAAQLWQRLLDGCAALADYAQRRHIRLAFEPEPGMFVDSLASFAQLYAQLPHPSLGLTIDIGHLVCQGELPVSEQLMRWKNLLWNVHIEDMRRHQHDHLLFGEGEVDFNDVFRGLRLAGYTRGLYVELSRHSTDAVVVAQKAHAFIAPFLKGN
jgi:sugar phosphate isomerase/epimerase